MKKIQIIILALFVVLASTETVRSYEQSKTNTWNEFFMANCKNWDMKRNVCIQCHQGCAKWENICVKIIRRCARWDDWGNCTRCDKGYGDLDRKSIGGACPQYDQNYTVNENRTEFDENCQCHNDMKQCTDCYSGYYLDMDNYCQSLPQNCTAADPQGNCTACYNAYIVQNGECVRQPCDISLCQQLGQDGAQCITCTFRSYWQDGCCIQVNGYCSKWEQTTGVCTQCYVGYVINKNNDKQCILESN